MPTKAIALLMSASLVYCHFFSPALAPTIANRVLLASPALLIALIIILLIVESIKVRRLPTDVAVNDADNADGVAFAYTVGGPIPVDNGDDIIASVEVLR